MPRLRAVSSSHAPGRSGTPALGQRWSAMTIASCTRSSATSMSPSRRVSEAHIAPTSSRKTVAIASKVTGCCSATCASAHVHGYDRADLDGVVLRRPPPGKLDRLVEVGHLDDRVPGDRLLRLEKRPVGDERLPARPADRGRVPRRLELLALLEARA